MSKKDRVDGFDIALGAFGIAGAIVAIWIVIQLLTGLGGWWHDINTVSPERQQEIDRQAEEWKKSPMNPKVAGQKCLDAGGYPVYSAWDGRFDKCEGAGNKSVDIEINQ